jgi:uncharacterized protein (AIM24 family)
METKAGGGKGAFSRMFLGESFFQNVYTAEEGSGIIAFASRFTGSIRAVRITPDKPIVCQKSAFLASEIGVSLSVFFQKKLSVGLMGGEGFLMQKLSGSGEAFLEIDGFAVEHELAAGQSLILNTGCLAVMDATCSIDIKQLSGVKNMLFGGEGLFNTKVSGPGRIILQTMPINRFASQLIPYLPARNNNR